MPLTLAEGMVDAVKAVLTADLPAKLDGLDTEYADGIVLADPEAYWVAEKSLALIQKMPAVFVLADSWDSTRFLSTSAGGGRTDSTARAVVGVLVSDQDTETLRRRLYRYTRAFWEVLLEAEGAGTLSGWILGAGDVIRADYSALFSDDRGFVGDARLEIGLHKSEVL